jgi:anti-sigma B factor antagonist
MTIEERASGSVMVLDVDGPLTIEALIDMPLTANVRRLLQEGRKQILLNLENVPNVDTTGICNIVEAYVTTRRQGGSLKLLHLTAHVRAVLAVTRLLTILDAYESEADAVASFGSAVSSPPAPAMP